MGGGNREISDSSTQQVVGGGTRAHLASLQARSTLVGGRNLEGMSF